jgi:hypothetical protein
MAKLVFGMNQSLDGYVDHMAFAPSPTLRFASQASAQTVRGPAVRSSTPWGRPGCSPSPIPPGIRLRASAWPGSAPLPLVTSDSFAAVYHGGGLRARHALRSPPPPGSRGRLLGETGLPWSWEYEWFKPTAR